MLLFWSLRVTGLLVRDPKTWKPRILDSRLHGCLNCLDDGWLDWFHNSAEEICVGNLCAKNTQSAVPQTFLLVVRLASPSLSPLLATTHSYPGSSTSAPPAAGDQTKQPTSWKKKKRKRQAERDGEKRRKKTLSILLSCWLPMQQQKQFYHFKWVQSVQVGGRSRGECLAAVPHALTLLWRNVLAAFSYHLIQLECRRLLPVQRNSDFYIHTVRSRSKQTVKAPLFLWTTFPSTGWPGQQCQPG